MRFAGLLLTLLWDVGRFLLLCLRPSPALAAENLFLRKQLALYQERHTTPRRATNATRLALVWLGRWFDWRQVLALVQPATFLRWHRQGFQLFWHWQSCPGRPRIPTELQVLIRQMTQDNPTWGQERMANELLLKLGLRVSPRTVRKYMPGHCVGDPGIGQLLNVTVLPLDAALGQRALALAVQHGLRGADAVYAAVVQHVCRPSSY
jgi:hypothetical protein